MSDILLLTMETGGLAEKNSGYILLSKAHSILLAEKIARFAQIKKFSYLPAMCGLKNSNAKYQLRFHQFQLFKKTNVSVAITMRLTPSLTRIMYTARCPADLASPLVSCVLRLITSCCSSANPEGLTALWVGNVLPEVNDKKLVLMFSK